MVLAIDQGGGLAARNYRLVLWNLATDQTEIEFKGHTGQVQPIAFTPDGQTLATTSLDGTVKLRDSLTGQERLTLRYEDLEPSNLAFADDQTLVVAWTGESRASGGLVKPSTGVVTLYRATAKPEPPTD